MATHRSRLGIAMASLALLAMALGPTTAAAASPSAALVGSPGSPPGDCPTIMPLTQIVAGQTGTGWTVTSGHTPQPFVVHILGVMPDGIAPGHDMVVIRIADEPGSHIISDAGGIWAGMSGSPVYVAGELVGSVSYGFSTGPSMVGGLTPAEDMATILTYPGATTAARTFRLSPDLRRMVAHAAGVSLAAASSFSRLPVPFVVSGLDPAARKRLQVALARQGIDAMVVPGAAAKAPRANDPGFATPVPGGNFAGLISYGDVTVGGVGTTTYVCAGRAIAFGHPLAFAGRTAFGANDADALAIVTDPTLTPFKMANIGDLFGVLDQDRLVGIRAHLATTPALIPVTARVRSLELGRSRTGETDVTMSDFVEGIAPQHLFSDIISATDRQGAGTALLHWVIKGTRPNGDPWTLDRTDRVTSSGDIASAAAFALDDDLYTIANNPLEPVTFDSVSINTRVSAKFSLGTLSSMLVSRNGGPFTLPATLKVKPGDALTVRVKVRQYGGVVSSSDVHLTVPADAVGSGQLVVVGGADVPSSSCAFDPSSCPRRFPGLLRTLANAPRGDDIVATLGLFGPNGPLKGATSRATQPVVVSGELDLDVLVR